MTGTVPASPPGPAGHGDLTARLFRALYQAYDLHTVAGVHVAVPKGSPCYAGPSLGAIARQISGQDGPAPPAAAPAPAPPPHLRRRPPRPVSAPDPHDPP